MKHLRFILFILPAIIIISTHQSKAQDFSNAGDYLSYINEQYGNIMKEQWDYTKAISKGKGAKKIEKRRVDLLTAIKEAKTNVFKMPRFNGDATFKGFVAKHLDINYILVNEDYAKIVDMEEVAEQSYDAMEAYLLAKEKANEKLADAAEQMDTKVDEFAEANNIELIADDSKLAKKMRNAGEVYHYYNKYYLVFFKSYIQESYFIDALGKGDVNAAEQSKSAMVSYAKEGLDSLVQFGAFRGDASMMKVCKETMQFYINEGEKKAPYLTDYFLKKEKFEKIKANFEKIKANKRTKADVDKYNGAINELNAAVAKYNEVNEELAKERKKTIERWNKEVDSFLRKHAA